MADVLWIEASPKGERAGSTTMARAFLEAYRDKHPDDSIRELNVWSSDLPEFGEHHARAKLAPLEGERRTEEQRTAWERVEAVIRDFDAADKIVLSTPMWNFSIPHKLKNYIDILVQPTLTFGFDAEKNEHVGLLRDRPVQLILTRSSTKEGNPEDFQLPSLKFVLGFIGLHDVRALVAGATTQPDAERRASYIKKQCERARAAALDF